MTTLVIVLHSLLCVIIVALVLMHSGRDAGLSGAFGMGGSSSSGGSTAVVERNLTRATIVASLLFAVTTYLLSRLLDT
jgi:preprotein translocase subunit SecG